LQGGPVDKSISHFPMKRLNRAIEMISTAIAAILLIGGILPLYLVTNAKLKLGLIGLFTVSFALCIHGLTNATKAELFASTAA